MTLSLSETFIDAGWTSGRNEFPVSLSNDGPEAVEIIAVDVPEALDGLKISGQQPPFTLSPGDTKPYILIVDRVGADKYSGTWVFRSAGDSADVAISGERKTLWPFRVNWNGPFVVTHQFKTAIFAAKKGKETRIAERHQPRKTISHSALVWGDERRKFANVLAGAKASPFVLPDPTQSTALLSPSGATGLEIKADLPWAVPDAHIVIGEGDTAEMARISVVDGGVVTLSRALTQSHAAGTLVRAAWYGRIGAKTTINRHSNDAASAKIMFEEEPGSSAGHSTGVAAQTFNGLEVYPQRPNWRRRGKSDFAHPVDRVDYGRGVPHFDVPIEYATDVVQLDHLLRGESITEFVQFFHRMRGRQGEFLAPSWMVDLVLRDGVEAPFDRTLRVRGHDVYDMFKNDGIRTALSVMTPTGKEMFSVTDLQKVSDEHGDDTLVSLGEDWGSHPATWSDISWMTVCRFATDQLTIKYTTNQIAQVRSAIQTLEDLG